MPDRLNAGRTVAFSLAWLGMCVAACDWPWRHDMVDQPSATVSSSARSPAVGSVAIEGEALLSADQAQRQLHNPVPPDAPLEAGRSLYRSYCAPCHGANGASDGPVSKYFMPMRALDSTEVQQHNDGWLFATITNGTDRMPSNRYELTPDERWEIVHFLRSVSPPDPVSTDVGAPFAPSREATARPPKPVAEADRPESR